MLKIKEAKTQANEPPVCVTFIPKGIVEQFPKLN